MHPSRTSLNQLYINKRTLKFGGEKINHTTFQLAVKGSHFTVIEIKLKLLRITKQIKKIDHHNPAA